MKALYWLKDNWRYVAMVLAGIDAVGAAVIKYMDETPGPTDWRAVLMTAGIALWAYLKKAPGDLTASQAKQLAHEHAAEVLSQSMPPAARASLVPPRGD